MMSVIRALFICFVLSMALLQLCPTSCDFGGEAVSQSGTAILTRAGLRCISGIVIDNLACSLLAPMTLWRVAADNGNGKDRDDEDEGGEDETGEKNGKEKQDDAGGGGSGRLWDAPKLG